MTLVHVGIALRTARTRQNLRDIREKGGPSTNRTALLAGFKRGDAPPRREPQFTTWGKLDDGVDIFKPGTALKLFELPDDATDDDVNALLNLPQKAAPPSSESVTQTVDALAVKLSRLPPAALGILGSLVDYIIEVAEDREAG